MRSTFCLPGKIVHVQGAVRATLAVAVVLGVTSLASAAAPQWVAQILRKVPRTQEEMAAAFDKSKNSSVQVGVDEPMETPNFEGETSYDVTVGGKKESLKFAYSRLPILSYGMEVAAQDQESLPTVSKNRILTRVSTDYISLQIRVHRDLASGAVYLYYKPFAAVGKYAGGPTQEFAPLMEDSVRDVRGLGLFIKPGEKVEAANLRTFVACNKTIIVEEGQETAAKPATKPHYELQVIRARIDGDKVALHTFVTNEYGKRFHYVKPYETPKDRDACDVKSVMYFTEYTAAKQSPSAKALRQTIFNSRASFSLEQLDAYAKSAGLEGDALDNLTAVLDAAIDGKIAAE